MKMKVYLLDLKDDEKLIAEYLKAHENVEPAVRKRTNEGGVIWCQVLRKGNRLVQFMLVNDDFDQKHFDEIFAQDAACVKWNNDMMAYQQPVPAAPAGDLWTEAEVVYDFHNWDNMK